MIRRDSTCLATHDAVPGITCQVGVLYGRVAVGTIVCVRRQEAVVVVTYQ